MLRECLWIPGVLHVVHHVVGELLLPMSYRGACFKQLSMFTGFFRHKHLRERFMTACLIGQHQRHRVLFEDFPATYIEWRWSMVKVVGESVSG